MAKQDAGFVDKHIEKVAVTLCALVLIGAVGLNFVVGRFKVNDMTVPALVEKAGEEAQRTANAIQSARPPRSDAANDKKSKDDPIKALAQSFGPKRVGLAEFAEVPAVLPRTQMFPPTFKPVTEKSASEKHSLAKLVRPGPPVVSAGQTTFKIPKKAKLDTVLNQRSQIEEARTATWNWASVGSQIDLVDQNTNYLEAAYPEGAPFDIVRVDLQRLDTTEPWRGWENVETYQPYTPLSESDMDGPRDQELLRNAADIIARTRLPERKSGDKVEIPALPYLDTPPESTKNLSITEMERAASRRVSKWTRDAQDALAGKRQFKDRPDVDAAYILASAATATTAATEKDLEKAQTVLQKVLSEARKAKRDYSNPILHQPERLMPIMAHDCQVVPGHEYVYRIRYAVLNNFANNAGSLLDEADADKITLVSDWSQPSLPVKVDADTYFFLTNANSKTGEAVVTVFKKSRRGVERKEFAVRVGDKIGKADKRGKKTDFSTDAICIGIDFDGKKDVILTYLNEEDGSIGQRLLSRDRDSKLYKALSKS